MTGLRFGLGRTRIPILLRLLMLMSLVAAHLATPQLALAQSQPHRLIVNPCDSDGYPTVRCAVNAIDHTGLPVADLAPSAFEVLDGARPATQMTVTKTIDSAARISIVLVVDASRSLRGAPLQQLRTALNKSLKLLSPQVEVALVGVTGQVNLGNGNSNAMPVNANTEISFTSRMDDVLARIDKLDGQGGTPLFEALYKAAVLAEQKPAGTRAVLVLSDGRDTKSTTFSADHAIGRAVRSELPVFTFGFGPRPDEAMLRRIALETGGDYLPASNKPDAPDQVAVVVQAIQARLQTRYQLTFRGAAASDEVQHTFAVRVSTPDGLVESAGNYRALLPHTPQITAVRFQSNNQDVEATRLPARDITVLPVLVARNISRVEYGLNGRTEVVKQAPFALKLDGQDLSPGSAYSLTIRAYGLITDSTAMAEQMIGFVMALPIRVPVPTSAQIAVVAPRPATWADWAYANRVAILVAAVGLLALLIGTIVMVMRRRKHARSNSPLNMGTLSLDYAEVQPVIDAADRAADGLRLGAAPAPRPRAIMQTMVLRPSHAWLEFTNGVLKGQHFPLGMPGMESLLIGREVDSREGIRLNSPFVSREHARLVFKNDAVFVVDLGSASGTTLNDRRLRMKEQEPVQVGDRLTFGDVQAVLTATGS